MFRVWLLSDASYQVLFEGKNRPYHARHGKPPLVVRGVRTAATVVNLARDRYLHSAGDDGMPHAPRAAS